MTASAALTVFGVQVLRADMVSPCVVCAGYPAGWGHEMATEGRVRLCDRHEDLLRKRIGRVR